MQCYYGTDECGDDLWQCQTCKEWFCKELHWHETQLGYCVECVACEEDRIDQEAAESEPTEYGIEVELELPCNLDYILEAEDDMDADSKAWDNLKEELGEELFCAIQMYVTINVEKL